MTLDLTAIRAREKAAMPMDLYEAGKALGMAYNDRSALLAEVERLREALEKHGRHMPYCQSTFLEGKACDCGLDAALEAPR